MAFSYERGTPVHSLEMNLRYMVLDDALRVRSHKTRCRGVTYPESYVTKHTKSIESFF